MSAKPKVRKPYQPPVDLERLHQMIRAASLHALTLEADRHEGLRAVPIRRPIEMAGTLDVDTAREIERALRAFYNLILDAKMADARRAAKKKPSRATREALTQARAVCELLSTSAMFPDPAGGRITQAEAVQAVFRCHPDGVESEINRFRKLARALPTTNPVIELNIPLAWRAYRLIVRVRRMGTHRAMRMGY